jgi:hypothetical protein
VTLPLKKNKKKDALFHRSLSLCKCVIVVVSVVDDDGGWKWYGRFNFRDAYDEL